MEIRTEPDYGVPQFTESNELLNGWHVKFDKTATTWWSWSAVESLETPVRMRIESYGNEALTSYELAKEDCVKVLESFTPSGYLPKSYISTQDASREVHRLENGRWVCLRDNAVGEHDFATASLAADAHEFEEYGEVSE